MIVGFSGRWNQEGRLWSVGAIIREKKEMEVEGVNYKLVVGGTRSRVRILVADCGVCYRSDKGVWRDAYGLRLFYFSVALESE